MRKYGNNMKCAFISVLMNLINGKEPSHNFLPSKSRFKKSDLSLLIPSHNHAIFGSQTLRIIRLMRVYLLARSGPGMLWNTAREFGPAGVSHEWSWNWEIFLLSKKCGDINPFASPAIIGTPDWDDSRRASLFTVLPALLLRLQSQRGGDACITDSVRAGLSLSEEEQYEATHVFRALIWFWCQSEE